MALAAIPLLIALVHAPARAQQDPAPVRHEVFVGSEIESYLRYLHTLGAEPYPWTIRGFGPAEVERLLPTADAAHPWRHRYDLASRPRRARPDLELVTPEVRAIYNTGFPTGRNDGALWAGRGATVWMRGGMAARFGPVSLVLAPEVFTAENRDFALHPNGATDSLRYGAWRDPRSIDLPQRFGDERYARMDPGQSTLRLDLAGAAVGISTANQFWGPAIDNAVILGDNAPGFAHLFVGTARPVNFWLARLHARSVTGRLEQSPYSSLPAGSDRLMSGLVLVMMPRGLEGLEIGGSRFFHDSWPVGGPDFDDLLRPFEGFLKQNLNEAPDEAPGNQLVSVFFRWAVPGSGFELYGEYGREDHSWNMRHLLLEPDDIGAYLLGFRKAWLRSDGILVGLRGEVYSSETSHLALTDMARGQSPMYRHGAQRQGHTHRGQMLASSAGFGGGASVLAMDLYHAGGRWTFEWNRTLRAFDQSYVRLGVPNPAGRDVLHSAGVEGELFHGRFDIIGQLTAAYDFNRNLAGDSFNLRADVTLRARI
jgi:hypothetical protein